VVTHQLQVERRTGKVRRPETDVLPLCRATNWQRCTRPEKLHAKTETRPRSASCVRRRRGTARVRPPLLLSADRAAIDRYLSHSGRAHSTEQPAVLVQTHGRTTYRYIDLSPHCILCGQCEQDNDASQTPPPAPLARTRLLSVSAVVVKRNQLAGALVCTRRCCDVAAACNVIVPP